MYKKFGKLMQQQRTKKDITLKQLVDIIEQEDGNYRISQSYLSRLERDGYDNPSILNILKITEILSLNLYDVIKSFGFSSLVEEDSLQSLKNEDIFDIIREKSILAPLNQDGRTIVENEDLDEKEKELIISVLNLIFIIGACSEEKIPNNITLLLENIWRYRDIRINKALYGKEERIEGTEYSIKFSSEAIKRMEKFDITKEEVIRIIYNYISLLDSIGDEMAFQSEDGDVVVNCLIADNLVKVDSVLKVF